MPTYEYGKVTKRNDKRLICRVNKKTKYLSRVLYCNYNKVTLKSIKDFQIHHKDRDVENNEKENLVSKKHGEHISIYHNKNASGKRSNEFRNNQSQIMKNRWKIGFKRKKKQTKYKEYINRILEMDKDDYSQVQISKELKIPRTSIQHILKGWRNVSDL